MKKSSIDAYNTALVNRGKELGFRKIEEYCDYILSLPFRNFLSETKNLILYYNPLVIYHNKIQLDSLSSTLVEEILEGPNKEEKPKHASGWLQNILTAKIDLKSSAQEKYIDVLGIEASGGEEIYGAAIRLQSVTEDNVFPRIIAVESNLSLIEKARAGLFHRGKVMNLSDNYRTLNFEKSADGRFKISQDIRDRVHFRKIDFLQSNLSEDEQEKYKLVFCNNLPRFYPKPIVNRLIEKTIPYVAPNGLLFISFSDISSYPSFKHLDILGLGKTFIYRRNKNALGQKEYPPITIKDDSTSNRVLYCKVKFIKGDYAQAMKEIDLVLGDHIDDLSANLLKGDLYVKQDKLDKGIFQYSKTLLIDPMFLPARYNMAALYMIKGDQNSASQELEKVITNLDNFDFSTLKPMFNIGFGSFVKHCRNLKRMIDDGAVITLEKLEQEMERDRESGLLIPDVEIPDWFEEKARMKENIEKAEDKKKTPELSPEPLPVGERKVVNISELPSTRDYGEHDPWKKKLAREARDKEIQQQKDETTSKEMPVPHAEAEGPRQEAPPESERSIKPRKPFVQSFDGPVEPRKPFVNSFDASQDKHKTKADPRTRGLDTNEIKTGALNEYKITAQSNVPVKTGKDAEFERRKAEARQRVEEQRRKWAQEQKLREQDRERWSQQARQKAQKTLTWMEEAKRRALEAQNSTKDGGPAFIKSGDTPSNLKKSDNNTEAAKTELNLGGKNQKIGASAPIDSNTLLVRPSRTPSIEQSGMSIDLINRGPDLQKVDPARKAIDTKKMLDTSNLVSSPIEELKNLSVGGIETFEQLFPKMFLDSMEELLIKEDAQGIMALVRSYLAHLSGFQKHAVHLLSRICDVFEKDAKQKKGRRKVSARLREVRENLKKLKALLHDKNLLEASILFHKVLKVKPLMDSLPDFQKNRLKKIKGVLENKSRRYEEFINHYFSDPVNHFQAEMWEALAQLTPPAALEETGKKYGLDPEKKPRNL